VPKSNEALHLLGVAAYLGLSGGHGETATGTVVSMRQVSATRAGGVSTYAPSITYIVNGQTYTHHSSTSSFPPAYKVGENVALLYKKGDPNDARIDSWSSQWLFPSLLAGAGLLVAVVAVPLTLLAIRRRKRIAAAS
jgi:hypothetical protein